MRYFRGAVYISISNPNHVSKGVRSLTVDGREFIGNVLPIFGGKSTKVEVVMG